MGCISEDDRECIYTTVIPVINVANDINDTNLDSQEIEADDIEMKVPSAGAKELGDNAGMTSVGEEEQRNTAERSDDETENDENKRKNYLKISLEDEEKTNFLNNMVSKFAWLGVETLGIIVFTGIKMFSNFVGSLGPTGRKLSK